MRAWPSAIVSAGVDRPTRVASRRGASVPGSVSTTRRTTALAEVLAEPVPVVVDADGLTLLADVTATCCDGRSASTVLTPHEREFARLAPTSTSIGRPGRRCSDPGGAAAAAPSCSRVPPRRGRCRRAGAAQPHRHPVAGDRGHRRRPHRHGRALTWRPGSPALDAASVAAFVHGMAGRLASDGAAVTAPDVVAALPDAIRAVIASLDRGATRCGVTRVGE